MKKVIALILTLSILSCFGSVLATDVNLTQEESDLMKIATNNIQKKYEDKGYLEVKINSERVFNQVGVNSEERSLANMDLESASPEMKKAILEARNKIINSSGGWYDDSDGMYMVWYNDQTKEWGELPTFNELFPGWDIPVQSINSTVEINEQLVLTSAAVILFDAVTPLRTALPDEIISHFCTWDVGNGVYYYNATVKKLNLNKTCNIGLTNLVTNKSLGFGDNLFVNGGIDGAIPGRNYSKLGFRASTYESVQGSAGIYIYYEKQ